MHIILAGFVLRNTEVCTCTKICGGRSNETLFARSDAITWEIPKLEREVREVDFFHTLINALLDGRIVDGEMHTQRFPNDIGF